MYTNLHERCANCCNSLGTHRSSDSACPERDDLINQRLVSFSTDSVYKWRRCSIFRKTLDSRIEVELTFAQHTTIGELIGDIYYRSSILSLIEHGGYPHNGGEHTLFMSGTVDELQVVLDLIQERFSVLTRHAVALCQLREIQRDLYIFAGLPVPLHPHQQQALKQLAVGSITVDFPAGAGKCIS